MKRHFQARIPLYCFKVGEIIFSHTVWPWRDRWSEIKLTLGILFKANTPCFPTWLHHSTEWKWIHFSQFSQSVTTLISDPPVSHSMFRVWRCKRVRCWVSFPDRHTPLWIGRSGRPPGQRDSTVTYHTNCTFNMSQLYHGKVDCKMWLQFVSLQQHQMTIITVNIFFSAKTVWKLPFNLTLQLFFSRRLALQAWPAEKQVQIYYLSILQLLCHYHQACLLLAQE